MKDIKIFLNEKNKKGVSIIVNAIKISEDEEQKIAERRRNYYITRKKIAVGFLNKTLIFNNPTTNKKIHQISLLGIARIIYFFLAMLYKVFF